MRLLAVVPAHNEEACIATVVSKVKALGHDILVIDDGSKDRTAAQAKEAGAQVISTGRKSGKGNALRQGFDFAVQNPYDAVIALDGDGQHDPADIRLFLDSYQKIGADVVNGNRMGDPKGMPWLRLFTNMFMSWIISMICRQKVPDTQCGFRFITTMVLRSIQLECNDFEIETEILIKASKNGFKISSVPIATIYRDEKSKINPIKDTGRFIRYLFKVFLAR